MVGILTAVLTEWVRSEGRVDEGAAMGVVFTTLFALGLVMIVQAADHVDLDANCVLHGAIEMTPWIQSARGTGPFLESWPYWAWSAWSTCSSSFVASKN